MENICPGDGSCLTQGGTTENGYTKRSDVICQHDCQPILCPNYQYCENRGPRCYLDCHAGLCTGCNMNFGTWINGKGILQIANGECPVCYENTLCFSTPTCNHYLCKLCHHKIYIGHYDGDVKIPTILNSPKFPYPELEEEYDDNPTDSRFVDDPKIVEYETRSQLHSEIEENINDIYYGNATKKCPICRSELDKH